jgi:hypothetical protein
MTIATPPTSQTQQLRQKVDQWVGQVFFGTLMKQVRESPFKSEMFSGGRGGGAFQQMLDGILVERGSRDLGGKLTDAIVRKLDKSTPRTSRYESDTVIMKPGTERPNLGTEGKRPGTGVAPGLIENELRRRGVEFRNMVVPQQTRIIATTESRHGTIDRTV